MINFLNNIWISISTPNPELIKILSIPLAFIESSLTLYLLMAIFNFKPKNKEKSLIHYKCCNNFSYKYVFLKKSN